MQAASDKRLTVMDISASTDLGNSMSAGQPGSSTSSKDSYTFDSEYKSSALGRFGVLCVRFLENYRMHIVWIVLYTLVAIGLFVYKVYGKCCMRKNFT